jgi:multidrug efflux system membrane fusion protein
VEPAKSGAGQDAPGLARLKSGRGATPKIARTGAAMRGTRIVVAVLVVACLGLAGWHFLRRVPADAQAPSAPPRIPVEVAQAKLRDVPVYLQGLGNVQAFNTVTIRSRVDGELQKVAFVEGQDVNAGDVLAQIDPRPFKAQLDQAIAKKAQDEAQLANARLDVQRYTNLIKQNAISSQTLDTQRALVAQLEATIKGDDATIENAAVQLGYTTITAPISGRTGIRLVDQGNIVHAADATGLVVITQLQPISVIFTLPEDTLPEIAREMASGPLEVAILSRDEKTELDHGTLALIDNQIASSTATIKLKATLPNKANLLWPGQFVKARLLLRTQRNVLTIPPNAVQRGAQGLFAYVVKPDQSAELRPLKVGQIDSRAAVIEDGLQAGEHVVTAGQFRLQSGSHVETRTAPTNAAEAAAP